MRPLSFSLIWFSFREDADCLLQSVRSARHHAPASPRLIVQDAAHPLPLEVQAQLRGMDCQVESDFVERGGNLNGLDHFAHQLAWLDAAASRATTPDPSAGWVVKIDSDTVLNGPLESWIGEASADTAAVCAVQPTWWFQGPCYAVQASRLAYLRGYLADHPQALRECAPKYPEDTCLGHLIAAAYGPKSILALPGGHSSTLFQGLQISHYDLAKWPPFDLYEAFRIVHFGNRGSLPPHMPDSVRRLTAAGVMKRYLDHTGLAP